MHIEIHLIRPGCQEWAADLRPEVGVGGNLEEQDALRWWTALAIAAAGAARRANIALLPVVGDGVGGDRQVVRGKHPTGGGEGLVDAGVAIGLRVAGNAGAADQHGEGTGMVLGADNLGSDFGVAAAIRDAGAPAGEVAGLEAAIDDAGATGVGCAGRCRRHGYSRGRGIGAGACSGRSTGAGGRGSRGHSWGAKVLRLEVRR